MANGTLAASQLEMLSQSGTGITTITPPATNTNRAITLPDAAGEVVLNSATQTLTNKTIQGGALTLATAVTASGTAVDFTGIPSWVKRITAMFQGVSTNGTSLVQIQIGDSSGFKTTGYLGGVTGFGASILQSVAMSTSGFSTENSSTAAVVRHGHSSVCLVNPNTNAWTFSSTQGLSDQTSTRIAGGSNTLTGTLDRIRITTVNGTDTFDAGTINIMYEG